MIFVKAEPRDIAITIELKLEEIEHILNSMDNCVISFNEDREPELKKSVSFFKGEFWQTLNDIAKMCEENNGT